MEIGEELYAIVSLAYPELAGKLVGMLLQLGEDECAACLESQEHLAKRLDEAMAILDRSQAATTAAAVARAHAASKATRPGKGGREEEKRVDLEDGVARNFGELQQLCAGRYSAAEVEAYWQSLPPLGTPAAAEARARVAAAAAASPAPAPAPTPAPAPAPVLARMATATAAPEPVPVLAAAPDEGDAAEAEQEEEGAILGLAAFMEQLSLSKHLHTAAVWIEEQGACNLEEVLENIEEFAEALPLRPLEKSRLLKGAEAAAAAAMDNPRPQQQLTAAASTEPAAHAVPAPEEEEAVESQLPAPPEPAVRLNGAGGPAPTAAAIPEEFPALGAGGGTTKGRRKKL
mmetsp:Transcript_31512/g.91141  ORF Transcript_31512/g.91141 Transcript_31512/m.91141 type:complete len:345 (-) Transcript_31512:104-1138(-)